MKNKFIGLALAAILAFAAILAVGLVPGVSQASPDGVTILGPGDAIGGVYITPGSRNRALTSGNHAAAAIDQNQSLLVSDGDVETFWAVSNVAAANTAAVVTKTAGAAGVRHVATGFVVTFASVGAPTPELIVWRLRDGTDVVWSGHVSLPAVAGESKVVYSPPGFKFVGTAASSMTIETTAGGGANDYLSVNLCGYDIK